MKRVVVVAVELQMMRDETTMSPTRDELSYSFVYIAHPRAVTGFSWRATSKYMPRSEVNRPPFA